MARFVIEETIEDGADGQAVWDRLRQYLIAGRTIELVRRTVDGQRVVEVRRWIGVREDRSNLISADPDQDY
ncbi:MAG: hypothetical protein AAGA25_12900 [Planctomycetota bacterium]